MSPEPRLNELAYVFEREIAELEGHRQILATALEEIHDLALDNADLDSPWNAVLHIMSTGGVRAAMNPTE